MLISRRRNSCGPQWLSNMKAQYQRSGCGGEAAAIRQYLTARRKYQLYGF